MTVMYTLPDVDTPTDRLRIVGWVVRDAIVSEGMSFTEASRRWPMALPTLNRLMSTGNVGIRFYRVAEKNLGLPRGFLDYIADGNVDAIRALPGISPELREMVLTELGEPPATTKRRNHNSK